MILCGFFWFGPRFVILLEMFAVVCCSGVTVGQAPQSAPENQRASHHFPMILKSHISETCNMEVVLEQILFRVTAENLAQLVRDQGNDEHNGTGGENRLKCEHLDP